jgi:hypothetical protein
MLKNDHIRLLPYNFGRIRIAFHFDADPDPVFFMLIRIRLSTLMRIRIQLPKMMRIRIRKTAVKGFKIFKDLNFFFVPPDNTCSVQYIQSGILSSPESTFTCSFTAKEAAPLLGTIALLSGIKVWKIDENLRPAKKKQFYEILSGCFCLLIGLFS